MKIGLLGCGTVGSGVVEIINKNKGKLSEQIQIGKILVKEESDKTLDVCTCNYDEILNDASIDTIVEVMGGYHPAYEYIMKAFQAKKNVVTANKAVVSQYFQEFQECAMANGVKFLIEATTGGGIPWINGLLKAKRIDEISEIKGIFNGTTNFILDNMFKNGVEFADILKEAQRLGYAEQDPSADIDGYDIQRKCHISANLAFNTYLDADAILRFGIRTITKADVDLFISKHQACKLMAYAKRYEDAIVAYVEPTLFHESNLMANVESNFNIACLCGDSIGELKFYGQGAGKLPTANAILQDCLDIVYDEVKTVAFDQTIEIRNEKEVHHYYVRIKAGIKSENDLKEMSVSFENHQDSMIYYTKKISVKEMHELAQQLILEDETLFFAGIRDYER